MACLDQHLKDPEYANWVKNTLALKLTLDVLKPYVHQELTTIQTSIIDKGPPGATCLSCNVSRAPYCSNNVCNVYHNEIIDYHRYADPSFRNTNARNWTTDAWEIAKCFMPQMAGYKNCTPSDVDFSGIINIIINCKYFDVLVSCDLNQDGNMFCEARNMRNMLMHSDNLKVSETDFQENLELVISLLSCLNDTTLNCPEVAEQIKKLKTGERPITLDDVVDARKQAVLAIWEEFDKGKQEIKEFVDLCIAQLRQGLETTASIWKTTQCRLISNFVRGCKYSLISLVETECQRAKPKPCPQNEWNFKEFLKRFEQFPDVECLLDRHKLLLYPEDGSSSDIKKWDLFLICHILTMERRVKLPNHVVNYVKELKNLRNKILDNPDRFGENDLNMLNGYLDEPLKTEVKHIYAGECIADDALQLQIVLLSWRQNEDTMNSKPIQPKDLELVKELTREIEALTLRVDKLEKEKQHDQDKRKTNNEQEVKPITPEIHNQNDQIYEDIETCALVEPKNVDPAEEKQLQENITSKDRNKNVSIVNGGLNYFKTKENIDTACMVEGSIILKVTCKSIDQLIRFWDSCMDGSAVRAFAKIRDDYREYLGCSTLDFDLVLTKKEVHRCINHLVDRLSSRLPDKSILEEIKVKVTRAQSVSVAENVVSRKHEVEGQSLQVSLHVPPKPRPFYKEKILIKGLQSTTTEDCLFKFLEENSGSVPVALQRGEKEGVVLVTFKSRPDFEKLSEICTKHPLEGTMLQLSKVQVSNCIIVFNIPDDTSRDTIRFHFENTRRSDGGTVDKVVMNEEGCYCLVYFVDYSAVDKVLAKKHVVGNNVLTVKLYLECLGCSTSDVMIQTPIKLPHAIVIHDVEPSKLKFVRQSQFNRDAIIQQMNDVNANIIWPDRDSKAKDIMINCTLTPQTANVRKLAKSWKEAALKKFEDFMRNIVVARHAVIQEFWNPVMEKIKSLPKTNPHEAVLQADKDQCIISVVGLKQTVEIVSMVITDCTKQVADEREKEKQKVKENFISLQSIETKMLLAQKFLSKMKAKYPSIKLQINQKKNKISFGGRAVDIKAAKKEMFETIEKYAKASVDMSGCRSSLSLYETKQAKDYIVTKLKDNNLTAVWEVNDKTLTVYSTCDESARKSLELIKKCVTENRLGLTAENSVLLEAEYWQTMLDGQKQKYPGKIDFEVQQKAVHVCSTDDIVDEVLETVKKKKKTIIKDEITLSKQINRLLEKHHKDEIAKISRKYTNPNIQIDFKRDNAGFILRGPREDVNEIKNELHNFKYKVIKELHIIERPGLVNYMKSSKGKEHINTVEEKHHVVIDSQDSDEEKSFYQNKSYASKDLRTIRPRIHAECIEYGGRKIYSAQGDITELPADVLVNTVDSKLNPTGSLSKAICIKGGIKFQYACKSFIRDDRELDVVEVFLSPAGNLTAKHIVHIVGPTRTKPGPFDVERVLHDSVLKAMQKASEKNVKSVALPNISYEVYRFPVKMATRIIVQAVLDFFYRVQDSTIKEVYLCDMKVDTVEMFTEALVEKFGDSKVSKLRYIQPSGISKVVPRKQREPNLAYALSMGISDRIGKDEITEESAFEPETISFMPWERVGGSRRPRYLQSYSPAVQSVEDKPRTDLFSGTTIVSRPKSSLYTEMMESRRIRYDNKDIFIIWVYSLCMENIVAAIESLEAPISHQIKREVFDEDAFRILQERQMKGFIQPYDLSRRLHTIGMTHNVMDASSCIHCNYCPACSRLPPFDRSEYDTIEAMQLMQIVQWFFIDIIDEKQELVKYDPSVNLLIENAFKRGKPKVDFSDNEGAIHIIDFTQMEEYEVYKPKHVVNVIRRDLMIVENEETFKTPYTWTYMGKDKVKMITLQNTDKDYLDVAAAFTKSGISRNFEVTQIYRIQNRTLWTQYHAKKKRLDDTNKKTINERVLWHGTSVDAVDNINAFGFNLSYCGNKIASAFGDGVYFTVRSSLSSSDTYSRPDITGIKRMYMCRVLTGEYTMGEGGMRVPPPKAGEATSSLYDSVVNNMASPAMFMIFNDNQAYPEYLILFKKTA